MTAIVYIVFYIIVLCEILWWFTCTEDRHVPLLVQIVVAICLLVPGLHIISAPSFAILCWFAYAEKDIELKDNWFNRTFLGYNE